MSRVLVVEDDELVRGVVVAQLPRAGHKIREVETAERALALLDDGARPDIAVLDVGLPSMSGLTLLGQIRSRVDDPKFPAVFLSGKIEPDDIAAGRELGCTYLTKPFVASALVSAIERSLREPADTW